MMMSPRMILPTTTLAFRRKRRIRSSKTRIPDGIRPGVAPADCPRAVLVPLEYGVEVATRVLRGPVGQAVAAERVVQGVVEESGRDVGRAHELHAEHVYAVVYGTRGKADR